MDQGELGRSKVDKDRARLNIAEHDEKGRGGNKAKRDGTKWGRSGQDLAGYDGTYIDGAT